MYDQLIKRGRRKPLFVPGESTQSVDLGRDSVERMLPHRDPFLLVDGIELVDLEQKAIQARSTVASDDPVFRGHFPGDPVYPGVLQVEMLGQLGVCLLHCLSHQRATPLAEDKPQAIRLLKVHHAQFGQAVLPGAELTLRGTCIDFSDYICVCAGQVEVEGKIAALAIYELYMVESTDH